MKMEERVAQLERAVGVVDPAEQEAEPRPSNSITRTEDWIEQNPIRQWMKKNGVSFEVVAAMTGTSIITIRHWITGRRPSAPNLPIIASTLGLSPTEFTSRWNRWAETKPGGQFESMRI